MEGREPVAEVEARRQRAQPSALRRIERAVRLDIGRAEGVERVLADPPVMVAAQGRSPPGGKHVERLARL